MNEDLINRIKKEYEARQVTLISKTWSELIIELLRRWDALGAYKDDDFGEVDEVIEAMRLKLEKDQTQMPCLRSE